MKSDSKSVKYILESTSDVLFPDEVNYRHVEINSVGTGGDTPLHVLAWKKDKDGIETLINAGADVNAIGELDETPLHIAITNKKIKIIELLLSAGADVNIKCEIGDTPLERAKKKGGNIAKLFKYYCT